jgi:plasmid segregation protein ParM
MSLFPVVRAVDLGFGNAKFVVAHPPGGSIQCRSFPSLAPSAAQSSVSGGFLERPDTVVVESQGKRYEVGPGVGVTRDGCDHRILHQDYMRTPEYLALMRGIFHYMEVPSIDLLVVGLPVNHVQGRAQELERLIVGRHPTTNGNMVDVKKVYAMAQPIGGFMHYALTSGHFQMLRTQVNLVIDVDFVTLDWLLCDGMRPIAQRCGHTEGGVSAILKPIAKHVSQDHDVNFSDFTALDRGLRDGYFTLFGGQVPIARYLPDAAPVLDKAIAALCHSAGDGSDINNIFLVGGGAKLYASSIAARFPKHPVVIVDDPIYANVRGFHLAGEMQIKNMVA